MSEIVKKFAQIWSKLHSTIVLYFLSAFLFSKGYVSKISTKLYISIYLLLNILLGVLLWLCDYLIILNTQQEVNSGHKNNFCECLSIRHWNLNSISVHDYSKLCLLKAYILVHKFDIIYPSETYLDSTYHILLLLMMIIW